MKAYERVFKDINVTPGTGSKRARRKGNSYFKGYTLLEILAVITLIGLMAAIVFPVYTLREEKTEVNYIGSLIGSDFKSVQEEALCTQSEITILFSQEGYQFKLGEAAIVRQFSEYKFGFKLSEENSGETPGATSGATSGKAETEDTAATGVDDDSSAKQVVPELKFSKAGLSTGLTLKWETTHFSGTMTVEQDGALKWNYVQKK